MNDIKLIIWDLDETLWRGTLAEQDEVVINEDVLKRIHYLLDRGIVHSICSKNEAEKAEAMLKKLGIYDLFIFPKISFEDKGRQIKKIIAQAQLREQNVLFVDDNAFVLREAKYQNPKLNTIIAESFMQEEVTHWGKPDKTRARLAQYKILEEKEKSKTSFLEQNHNEHDFLKQCDINITLVPLDMNDKDSERVIDLMNRSNQLNFTHSRVPFEYLFTLFELKNGINFKVQVRDNYGDYGIVGYICIINNALVHFVFSCRILGMCVEARMAQWLKATYPNIKFPFKMNILKDYEANLDFIGVSVAEKSSTQTLAPKLEKILIRGPCLANAISFMLSHHYQVDEEIYSFFEYANLQYLRNNLYNDQDKRFEKSLQALNKSEYPVIVNFLESDYYSGNYKIQNRVVPVTSHYIFWEGLHRVKQDNQELAEHIGTLMLSGMRDIGKFNLGNHFSPWPRLEKLAIASMSYFGERWRKVLYQLIFYFVFKNYCGYVPVKQFEDNVRWYVGLFPEKTKLIFINPPEKISLPLLSQKQNQKIAERTRELNEVLRLIAKEKANVSLIEMDDFLEQEDIIHSFSHLKRQGYIKLSQSLLSTVQRA